MAITWDGAAWAPTTVYAVNARVQNGGNAYRCITAGTSAGSGGPSGTGADIVDGGVHWTYLGPYAAAVIDCGPNLGDIPPGAQVTMLNEAERLVQASVWDELVDDGQRFLAAHLAALYKLRGAGPLTEEHVGQLGRSYASLLTFGQLGLTPYGVEYQRLTRLLPSVLGAVF